MSEKIEPAENAMDGVKPKSKDVFFLGGDDREMRRIAWNLRRTGAKIASAITTWEKADVAPHTERIQQIIDEGDTPVAIELRGAENVPGLVDVDHHNQKSHRPAALLQVLDRLGVRPRMADRMVAANDAAYIPGMNKFIEEELERMKKDGASPTRLTSVYKWLSVMKDMIRHGDREAQGVTKEMEQEAEIAIQHAEKGPDGTTIIRLRGDRPSPVTDRLYDTWPNGEQKLVVICREDQAVKEVWYFGDGQLCQELAEHFKSIRQHRIDSGAFVEPPAGEPRGEYHSFSGGQGRGKKGENALALVVVSDPQEVLDYIADRQAV